MDMLAGKVKMTQVPDMRSARRWTPRRAACERPRDVTVHYGAKQALFGVSIDIPTGR
jgi:phosphate transport system ATP-binding protein